MPLPKAQNKIKTDLLETYPNLFSSPENEAKMNGLIKNLYNSTSREDFKKAYHGIMDYATKCGYKSNSPDRVNPIFWTNGGIFRKVGKKRKQLTEIVGYKEYTTNKNYPPLLIANTCCVNVIFENSTSPFMKDLLDTTDSSKRGEKIRKLEFWQVMSEIYAEHFTLAELKELKIESGQNVKNPDTKVASDGCMSEHELPIILARFAKFNIDVERLCEIDKRLKEIETEIEKATDKTLRITDKTKLEKEQEALENQQELEGMKGGRDKLSLSNSTINPTATAVNSSAGGGLDIGVGEILVTGPIHQLNSKNPLPSTADNSAVVKMQKLLEFVETVTKNTGRLLTIGETLGAMRNSTIEKTNNTSINSLSNIISADMIARNNTPILTRKEHVGTTKVVSFE